MKELLATKYRPKTFADVVGQRESALILSQMVSNDTVPTGLLFTGPSGVGKTTIARILAAYMNCESPVDGEPDGTCATCLSIADGTNLDVIEIDAASHAGVADMRELVSKLRYASSGKSRIVILDEAHNLSKEAFNALLKPIEESENTYFVLVTTEAHKVIDTIQSRLISFTFPGVPSSEIYTRLGVIADTEEYGPEPELLQYIALHAHGNVRNAIMDLDLCQRANIRTLATYKKLREDIDFGPALVAALMSGDHNKIFTLMDALFKKLSDPQVVSARLSEILRDIMVIQAGGDVPFSGPSLEHRKEIATKLESERILAAFRVLWDLKTRIRVSDNPRNNLDLSLILISDVFTKGKAKPTPTYQPSLQVEVEPEPEEEMTLADLKL